MASATATRSKLPAEIFIGGAGDERSRLVLSYAESRKARLRGERLVHYLPHWKIAAAIRLAEQLAAAGHPLALIGHSWGADTALRAASSLNSPILLIGADPVAKPVSRLTARDRRPPAAALLVHVDAAPLRFDRSDYVKAAGFLTGGGVPRAFTRADLVIRTRLNHWNFEGMMRAPDGEGTSAEAWLDGFDRRLSRTTC